jgi:hypothetical protein
LLSSAIETLGFYFLLCQLFYSFPAPSL